MKVPTALLALTLAASLSLAAPPPAVPTDVQTDVGLVMIKLPVNVPVKTYPLDPGLLPPSPAFAELLALIPADKQNFLLYTIPEEGTYRVLCWTGDATGPSEAAVITITAAKPDNLPKEVTELLKVDRVDAASGLSVKDAAAKLRAIYTASDVLLKDQSITTCGQLIQAMNTAANKVIGENSLVKTRTKFADELDAKNKVKATDPLTDKLRDFYRAQFKRFARALTANNLPGK